MTRLIDADKLLKQLEWLDIDDFILYEEVKEDIDESPTVEAIPIEWIKIFMQRYKIQGGDEYKLLHFMITEWKKWEKENELDKVQ